MQIIYVCEWCEPSDIPETNPESCRILVCPKHRRCWHWPKAVPDQPGGLDQRPHSDRKQREHE